MKMNSRKMIVTLATFTFLINTGQTSNNIKDENNIKITSNIKISCEQNMIEIMQEKKITNPKMCIGSSDFRELVVESDIFIDKTLFIKDIIESKDKALLITRPRRWGKSLNFSMLKYFLSVQVDEQGEKLDQNPNKELFESLKISQQNTTIKDHVKKTSQVVNILNYFQGQYPVVSLSFKDCIGKTYLDIKQSVGEQVYRAYKEHDYLLKSEKLNETEKADFKENFEDYKKLSKTTVDQKFLESINLNNSLKILTEILHKHHGQKSYVLIDEYDGPLNNIIDNLEEEKFTHVTDLFSSIFTAAFKDNKDLEKGMMTGVLRIAQASLFSKLNNFTEYNVLTEKYSQHYGFTQDDVDDLLSHYPNLDKIKVKTWYNGYNIGNLTIYNPWSVAQYLSSRKIKNYWIATGGTALIDRVMISDELQNELDVLRKGQSVFKRVRDITNFGLIEKTDSIWSLLLYTGYLTTDGKDHMSDEQVELRIPNEEVKSTYIDFLIQWIEKNKEKIHKIDMSKIHLEKREDVEQKYQAAIQRTTTKMGKMNEALFHHLITGRHLYEHGIPSYTISPELKTGHGYSDHVFYPIGHKSNTAIIHEYKYTTNVQGVKDVMEDAWWQIYEKDYMSHPLKTAETEKNITSLIVRPLVFLYNESTHKITVRVEEQPYTLGQAEQISHCFRQEETQKALKLGDKNRNKTNARQDFLKTKKHKTLKSLLDSLTSTNRQEESREYSSNYSVRKHLNNIQIDSEMSDVEELPKPLSKLSEQAMKTISETAPKKVQSEVLRMLENKGVQITKEQLQTLKGIGRTKAERIIEQVRERKKRKYSELDPVSEDEGSESQLSSHNSKKRKQK